MPGNFSNKNYLDDYSRLLDNLPVIVYLFQPGHNVIFANKSFYNFFCTTPDEIIGRQFSPRIHRDDSEIFNSVINSLLPGSSIESFTCRIQLSDDDIRWTEWKITSLTDNRGNFCEYQAFISDQTERRKTELALKQSEQQYRLAFDQAADMIVIIDRMGNFLDLNDKFETESGWKRDEMVGKNVFTSNIITRESSHRISSYLNMLLSGEDLPSFEIQGVKKDGSLIDYEIRAVPIIKNGIQIAFQAILRNISDRKIFERALNESQRQLSNLMSNLPGMAYRCHYKKNWEMEFVSGGAYELTGYQPDAIINNKTLSYGDIIHPDDREMVFREVEKGLRSNNSFRLNYRIITADGKTKWVWEQGSGVRQSNGEIEKIEGFITDITEQRNFQEALRENEELYRKLISTLPDMILISDLEGKLIFMNDIGIRLSGFSSMGSIKGKNIFDFIAPKDRETALTDFENRLNNNLGPKEYSLLNKDGNAIDFEINGQILKDKDDKPYGMIFSCRDISYRKKTEAALAHSEEKYRTLVDSMQDGVFLIQDEELSFVNKSFADLVGYSVQEITGMNFVNLVSPEDRELVVGNYKKRQEGKAIPTNYEWRMLHRDGSRVFVNMNVRLINFKGKVASIGTIKDITHKRKMEEVLKRQQKILYGVAEASNILLIEKDFSKAIKETLIALGQCTDVDRVYIFENSYDQKSDQHFMSQRYEWVARNIEPQIDNPELQMLPYKPIFSDWYPKFLQGEYVWSLVKNLPELQRNIMEDESILSILEVPIKIKDKLWGFIGFDDCKNEREWTESEVSVLKAAAGSIGGAIEREMTNLELIAAKEKAEELNKIKSNFLANMSHELRTPLIAILGYAELLSHESENEEWKKMLDTIYTGGERLLETLNHLLDLSKIEADKVSIHKEPINVKVLVNEVVSLFSSVTAKKKIYLKLIFKDHNIECESDQRILRSILNNLISNALKFTEIGGVIVETGFEQLSDNTFLVIKVTDSGIGISESGKQIIYKEFRQASEGFSRHFEGTGLGLTITKKFVELLNGKIDFKSEQGKGTSFLVTIPVIRKNVISKNALVKPKDIMISENNSKNKVIVVDDDVASRSVVSLFLKKEYLVDTAATGEEAISMMQQKDYDLILLDISLGKGINGLDLIKLIRKKSRYSSTPVVAVTAHAMVGDREKFLNEGFDDYIAKPFTKAELSNKIRSVIL